MAAHSPPPNHTLRNKLLRSALLVAALGLAAHLLLPEAGQIRQALTVAARLNVPLVALAVAAQVLSYLSSGYLLRALVRLDDKHLSAAEGALITLGANAVGTLGGGLPGTAGTTYVWLERKGISAGTAGFAAWVPVALNNAMLAIVSVPGLAILLAGGKFSSGFTAGFAFAGCVLAAGIGGVAWSVTHREKLTPVAMAIAGFIARLRRKALDREKTGAGIGHALEIWDKLVDEGWRRPALGAALDTLFDMATLGLLFPAAGKNVSVLVLIAGYSVPQLLGKMTVVLGGVGVVETTMVALYRALGVRGHVAFVVVMVYRLLSLWLPTLLGVAAVVPHFGGAENEQAPSLPG